MAALAFLALATVVRAQTPITNGALVSGAISPAGHTDAWSFPASAGQAIMVRVGSTNFTPHIQLFDAGNQMIAETTSGNAVTRDGFVTAQAASTGTFTVLVGAEFSGQVGTYGLSLALAPGQFSVTPGDDGGALVNGAAQGGRIDLGDLDMWNFTANAGDAYMVRVGGTNFTPWVRLYDSNGALVGETKSGNAVTRDGFITGSITNTGSYTVVVSATYQGQAGGYGISLAQAPEPFTAATGDDGGALVNGAAQGGTMDLGDLDVWSFSAQAGDAYMVRVGSTNFTPWIRIYDPKGTLVGETLSGNAVTRDGFVTGSSTNTGSYTVVVSATYADQVGTYGISLAQAPESFSVAPGDDGGALTNGLAQGGTIDLGDLDVWSFSAKAGDAYMVRVGSTNFTPWIRLYDPNGLLVNEATSGNAVTRDGFITGTSTNAGNYTVVVSATYSGQTGGYGLNLAQAPSPIFVSAGDEGGSLTNGFNHTGTLGLGDLDVWSFVGTRGDSNVLRVTATNFTPWLRVYDPSGALFAQTTSGNAVTRSGSVSMSITNSGVYTVALSATYQGQSGSYTLKESRVPPDLILPETQSIDEGSVLQVPISAQDPDVPDKPLVFNLLSGPPGMTLQLAGSTNAVLSWSTTEVDGPSTNRVVATVTDTVNGHAFIRTNSFTVIVREINTPPQLTVPADQVLDELTPLSLSASASDVDIPANPLTFSLVAPPSGMSIDPASGKISWTPTEAQGPSTNLITVVVTDSNPPAANAVSLSTTNSFRVVVREVNTPPTLTLPADLSVDELTPLTLNAVATDADLPANHLTFTLVTAPSGMVINATDGTITWTPSEVQGPSTNLVTVQVQDDGAPPLSVTKSFTITVREVNSAPVLPVQTDRALDELTTLVVTNTATDSDLPANVLAYRLVGAPTNAVISADGVITWTPTEAQGPSTNRFVTVVTDNGTPNLSATNTFLVLVREVNTAPVLQPIGDQSLHFGTPLSVQAQASDSDLPANHLTFSLDQAPTGLIVSDTGLISWTPTESQVGTFKVTLRVADDGSPSLSASQSFSIVVSGSGARLDLERIAVLTQITITADAGNNYELQTSNDLTNWTKLIQFIPLPSSPFTYIDPESKTNNLRFYRLHLLQP